MPQMHPINAVRFATDQSGGDISTRIAPPYDVLDEGPKRKLLERDPHNIVAVDLPVTPPKTVGPDSAYREAGELYRQWLDEGVLVRDNEPSVVAYEQVYPLQGRTMRRRGLFTSLGVEPFNRKGGGIHRHEKTLAGGVSDRGKLTEATSAMLSPVFGIFSDPHQKVVGLLSDYFDHHEPDFHGKTDHDGVEHRCWLVRESKTLDALAEFFDPTDVFIADGHHRYTTALEFSREHPELPGAGRCLFALVASEDPGMVVLAYHRVIRGLTGFSLEKLREVAANRDDVSITDDPTNAPFALYDPQTGSEVGLTHRPDPLAEKYPDKPQAWRNLDVAILQHLVVDDLLGQSFGSAQGLDYAYTADEAELRQLARAAEPGEQRLGVKMRATPLQSVMNVSLANEVMPPKSTYFHPKLASGLVIHPLD